MADIKLTYEANCAYEYKYHRKLTKGGRSRFASIGTQSTDTKVEFTASTPISREDALAKLGALCKTKLEGTHATMTKIYAVNPWVKSAQ